jgi:hypothetical protein
MQMDFLSQIFVIDKGFTLAIQILGDLFSIQNKCMSPFSEFPGIVRALFETIGSIQRGSCPFAAITAFGRGLGITEFPQEHVHCL